MSMAFELLIAAEFFGKGLPSRPLWVRELWANDSPLAISLSLFWRTPLLLAQRSSLSFSRLVRMTCSAIARAFFAGADTRYSMCSCSRSRCSGCESRSATVVHPAIRVGDRDGDEALAPLKQWLRIVARPGPAETQSRWESGPPQ